ncbi:MAG: type II secretion system major pseudopilin GspG [Desulfobacterales bacterium]|nr:type II secretion system major pseudopilin GspG [Desulfobacterales bacterium]
MKDKRVTGFIRSTQGFTLIEIMVVIIIIGILATIVVPRFMDKPDEAKVTKAHAQIQGLETALHLFKLHNGFYPSTEQGLQALVEMPQTGKIPKKWQRGGYLEKRKVPGDPWNGEYIYLSPGVNGDFDIISYGADGVPGGEEFDADINNWDIE